MISDNIINCINIKFEEKSKRDEKRHNEIIAALQSLENNKEKVNGKS